MLLVIYWSIFKEISIISSRSYHNISCHLEIEHYLLSLKHVSVQSRDSFTGYYQYNISDYLHHWHTQFNYVSTNGDIEKDISNAFNKLKITRDEKKIDDVSDETLSLFKPKVLNAIDQIKQKKKDPI